MTATLGTATPARPRAGPSGAPALEVVAVERRFRGGRGLGPVDLAARRGETLGVMGRNGSGKTTLLRLCATLDRPGGGTVRWFGGGSSADARRRLGVALDVTEEEGTLSGRQAAHFWCSQWRAAAAPSVDAWLERLGLGGVADEPVAAYSFGMRRRLALVEALAHEPDLALLDEPTAGLDPDGAAVLAVVCAERAGAGRATLIASNDPAFVASACHRVAFLDDGRIAGAGAPGDLLGGLAGETVVELDLIPPGASDLPAHLGSAVATPTGVAVRVRPGADLAAIVAAVDRPGGRLVALRVRRTTLADAYVRVTGRPLIPPAVDG